MAWSQRKQQCARTPPTLGCPAPDAQPSPAQPRKLEGIDMAAWAVAPGACACARWGPRRQGACRNALEPARAHTAVRVAGLCL